MKKIFVTLLASGVTLAAVAQTKPAAKKTVAKKPVTAAKPTAFSLKSSIDSTSYAFGSSIGASLKTTGISAFNYEALLKGLKDVINGTNPSMTQQQSQEAISQAISNANKSKFTANINEGKTFLEQNKKRAGVQTTASGLQYEVLTAGSGMKPGATDSVLVHYKGSLLNGKVFDSSYDRGEPITLTLGQVIKGWTEGLQLMPAGSKYKFFIPYNLAYGERGAGQDIPPYSTLIFEVELLKINGK